MLLENRTGSDNPRYLRNGNVLLDSLHGATLHSATFEERPSGLDMAQELAYIGEGYGILAAGTLESIRMLAELEGILLNLVYSGKGIAGMIDLIRQGHFKKGQRIFFLHTRGSAALFGYHGVFDPVTA